MPSGYNGSKPEFSPLVGGERQKRLSASLFAQVKPICVSLSQIALLPPAVFKPTSESLLTVIKELNATLQDHRRQNCPANEYYSLLPNFADYVFFPLSNLLKQQHLTDDVIANVLDIVSFLIVNSWVPNGQFNGQLSDQLLPVILFLIKGDSKDIDTLISGKSYEFKCSANGILASVFRGLQGDYFLDGDMKRLSMLGDIASILLSMLKNLSNPNSPELQSLVFSVLANMKLLFLNSISTEQLTRIIPGITSTLINFVTQSKNLHFSIISAVIDLLRLTIVKVFNDENLSIEVHQTKESIEGFQELWETNRTNEVTSTTVSANVSVSSNEDYINDSWLKATSNKLKISLTALFKTLFIGQNKSKVSNKSQLVDSISLFVKDIFQFCFWSLFNELFALNIDILGLLCHARCFPDSVTLDEQAQMEIFNETILYLGPSLVEYIHSDVARKLLIAKMEDLINNKTALVLSSTSEDRILQFITSLKFHFLLLEKHADTKLDLANLVEKQLLILQKALSESLVPQTSSFSAGNPSDGVNGETGDFDQNNKLDNIELPPYVRADSIVKFNGERKRSKFDVSSDLMLLSKMWTVSEWTEGQSLNSFEESFSKTVEGEIENFLKFLSCLKLEKSQKLVILETLLLNNDSSTRDMSTALWLSNQFFGEIHRVQQETIKVDDFIDFGDDSLDEAEDTSVNDVNYLIVHSSQELMQTVAPHLDNLTAISVSKDEMARNTLNEKSYSIALDSIGLLSRYLPKDEFKENFLMDFLFPIFEALTYNSNPRIQSHARNTISMISRNHYKDSIPNLIIENSDYLVDSLSLKFSVPGSITPALPGILIIILEVSGINLLLTNQLTDVISQIFVLIDSYHGYSILVEGFFIFFDKLVRLVKAEYLKESENKRITIHDSLYKPWGMTSIQQMEDLVNDSGKVLESFEGYDRDKEYFTRKKDVPFSEMDSDDEEDVNGDDEDQEGSEEKKWESVVPKNIYFIIQRIFIYGLRLLSHPSDSLKVQILNTLIDVYPVMSTNYSLVLPLVAQNWSDIVSLLPTSTNPDSSTDAVTIRAIQLLTLMLETEKYKNDTFLSKRFIDSWTTIETKFNSTRNSSHVVKLDSFKRSANIKLLQSLSKYLITGLNNYERVVPDIVALKIMKFVSVIGVPDIELGRQAKNILWVVCRQHQS